jgi:hypothetical protein
LEGFFNLVYGTAFHEEKEEIQFSSCSQQKKVLHTENLPAGFFYLHNTTCEIYARYPRDIFTPKVVIDGLFLRLLLP